MAPPPAATSIGLDLGGTKCLGVVTDEGGKVLEEIRTSTPRTGPAILDALTEVASGLLATDAGSRSDGRVGAGVPGLVDADGVLRFAPNLPGVGPLRVAEELAGRLSLGGAVVYNDVTSACWAEKAFGAARDHQHVLFVALGTGIGGGVITDDRLLLGSNGFAGEVGHMVVDPSGPPCPCGQRGCWERFASGHGLGRLARVAARAGRSDRLVELAGGDPEAVDGEHAAQAAGEGDPGAIAVVGEFAWWLALGLANLANVFDPDRIVLGGGVVESSEVFLDPTRRLFGDLVEGAEHRPRIEIVPAELGERAGSVGAADLARHRQIR